MHSRLQPGMCHPSEASRDTSAIFCSGSHGILSFRYLAATAANLMRKVIKHSSTIYSMLTKFSTK